MTLIFSEESLKLVHQRRSKTITREADLMYFIVICKFIHGIKEFQEQYDDIEFSTCMMSLSIIRFITDHVKYLNVSAIRHLLIETDVLFLIIPLIEEKPWLRTNAKGIIWTNNIFYLYQVKEKSLITKSGTLYPKMSTTSSQDLKLTPGSLYITCSWTLNAERTMKSMNIERAIS